MKSLILTIVAVLALSFPGIVWAASEHGQMGEMSHMDHVAHMSDVAHEEVIDGVKATFKVTSMAEHLKQMGKDLPEGAKEANHLSVAFKDAKSGETRTNGVVKVRMKAPDKTEQSLDLTKMDGHFGAYFDMSQKGKYGITCKFALEDGKVRQSRFWYEVK